MSKSKKVDLIGIDVDFYSTGLGAKGKVTGIVTTPGEIDLTVQLEVSYNEQLITEREAFRLALQGVIKHYLEEDKP